MNDNLIYSLLALLILVILMVSKAPKLNVFYIYPKKTLIWLLVSSSFLLLVFLIFSYMAMK